MIKKSSGFSFRLPERVAYLVNHFSSAEFHFRQPAHCPKQKVGLTKKQFESSNFPFSGCLKLLRTTRRFQFGYFNTAKQRAFHLQIVVHFGADCANFRRAHGGNFIIRHFCALPRKAAFHFHIFIMPIHIALQQHHCRTTLFHKAAGGFCADFKLSSCKYFSMLAGFMLKLLRIKNPASNTAITIAAFFMMISPCRF